MVLIKINNIDFTLVDKEKLSSIVNGNYDVTKNSIALGDLGEDKQLIQKAVPLIFIRNHGIKLGNLCLLGEFNQEISFFKGKYGKTLLPDMHDLYLMNGFNKQLSRDSFSKNYEKLYLYNIGEQVLEIDSIVDNRRSSLYLMEGFKQPIVKGMITENVEKIFIGNIGDINKVFTVDSIPNSIQQVHFTDGFNQPIFKDLIPKGISVSLYNIGENSLLPESIPKTTSELNFKDGFNQVLSPGLITPGVRNLNFHNIGPNVFVEGFIPDQIEINSIQFHNGFNQPISKGLVSSSVKVLYFNAVGPLSLIVGSIPSTIRDVHFWDSFNLPLTPGIIEDGVKLVETNTKEIVLRVGSIPSSVKTLFLRNIMNPIEPGIIPNTVESLHMIGFNHNALVIGSLPNTLKELNLSPSHPQNSYVPGIIPDGLEELHISGKLELYVPPTTAVSKPSKYIYPFFPNIIPNTFTFLMTVFKYCLSLATTAPPTTNKDQEENQDQTPLSADKMNSQNSVLLIGSIPNSVKKIKLSHGFNHDLPMGIIPHSVKDIDLFEIKSKIEIGTFPNSIKDFRFSNKYDLPLPKGMIPEGVEKLELSDKNVNIQLSIPSTVKELTLSHGFNRPLVKGTIPCGVEKMSIYSIGEDALLEESVPDSVKYVFLGFNSDQAYSHFFPSLKK
ncbi:hypothetical protein ACTFIY_012205 [Dictyostelium cf. discoideum]